MPDDPNRLSTLDLMTRRIYGRSIDDGAACDELRRRCWPAVVARALEFIVFLFVAPERVLAVIGLDDLDAWDLPTTWRDVGVSLLFSLVAMLPLVGMVFWTLWRLCDVRGGWSALALFTWPVVGLCIMTRRRLERRRSNQGPGYGAEVH